MKTTKFLWLIVVILIMLVPFATASTQENNEDMALDVIARLNEWRVNDGLWPLKANDTLMDLAFAQAEFLYEQDLSSLSDWHAGRQGENHRQRAILDPYNWPYYNTDENVAIGEIAGYGSVDSAISFWRNSTIHHNTVVNSEYREVGVAAIPHENNQTIYVVVFGSRPDVLTAQVNPHTADSLYLSKEEYRFAAGDRIQEPIRVKILDADDNILTDWQPWAFNFPIPENAGDIIKVVYSDGIHEVTTVVNVNEDIVVLPALQTETVAESTDVETAEPTSTPTAMPVVFVTATPRFVSFVTNTPVASSVPAATNTLIVPMETALPAATATTVPTLTPMPTVFLPEVQITYDDRTMSIVNVAPDRIELLGVEFLVDGRMLPITLWTQVVDVPLGRFPVGACLQVWSWEETVLLPKPANCDERWSVLMVAPDDLFWTKGDFDVYQDGVRLTTCIADAGFCDVDLP